MRRGVCDSDRVSPASFLAAQGRLASTSPSADGRPPTVTMVGPEAEDDASSVAGNPPAAASGAETAQQAGKAPAPAVPVAVPVKKQADLLGFFRGASKPQAQLAVDQGAATSPAAAPAPGEEEANRDSGSAERQTAEPAPQKKRVRRSKTAGSADEDNAVQEPAKVAKAPRRRQSGGKTVKDDGDVSMEAEVPAKGKKSAPVGQRNIMSFFGKPSGGEASAGSGPETEPSAPSVTGADADESSLEEDIEISSQDPAEVKEGKTSIKPRRSPRELRKRKLVEVRQEEIEQAEATAPRKRATRARKPKSPAKTETAPILDTGVISLDSESEAGM